MGQTFTKDSIRDHHKEKVKEIMKGSEDSEEVADNLVNYIMSRISTVLSYERRKYERREAKLLAKNK